MVMNRTTRFAALAAAALGVVAATGVAASAQTVYDAYGRPVARADRFSPDYRPLTVNRDRATRQAYAPPVARGYDPYHGPATIVTAPIDVASRLVALPFQVVESIFPPYGNTPLVVVGAPVHAAGRIAQVPFNLMQAPFGRPAPYFD